MDYRIKISQIDDTWPNCNYKWRVFVENNTIENYNYILETLKKWFGDSQYFWDGMFLCGKKY